MNEWQTQNYVPWRSGAETSNCDADSTATCIKKKNISKMSELPPFWTAFFFWMNYFINHNILIANLYWPVVSLIVWNQFCTLWQIKIKTIDRLQLFASRNKLSLVCHDYLKNSSYIVQSGVVISIEPGLPPQPWSEQDTKCRLASCQLSGCNGLYRSTKEGWHQQTNKWR